MRARAVVGAVLLVALVAACEGSPTGPEARPAPCDPHVCPEGPELSPADAAAIRHRLAALRARDPGGDIDLGCTGPCLSPRRATGAPMSPHRRAAGPGWMWWTHGPSGQSYRHGPWRADVAPALNPETRLIENRAEVWRDGDRDNAVILWAPNHWAARDEVAAYIESQETSP